jgi:tetratricopeptide (TPR) repeat protein
LDEALGLARELNNKDLIAQILAWKSDNFFYAGDRNALAFHNEALNASAKSSDQALRITLQMNSFRSEGGSGSGAVAKLRALSQKADSAGLKYVSAEASLYAVEGLLKSRNYTEARPALGRLVADTEKLGARPLSAKAHFLLAELLRESGNLPEATTEYRSSQKTIEEMKKDAGDGILRRVDIKLMSDEANRWASSSNRK